MQYSDCRKPVVFVIDMVNGFIKEGALHDERIADIIPSIQKLLDALACRNVFVCDNHPPHTREFETFPKHCVIGSEEAEVVDELKPYVKSWISKNFSKKTWIIIKILLWWVVAQIYAFYILS